MSDAIPDTRDNRGDWRPPYVIEVEAPYRWPPQPMAALKWLFAFPGYLWPWNCLYLATALATWLFLMPDLATMESFEPWWIALILGRNLAMMFLYVGAWHLYLYTIKGQGTDFRYSARPFETNSSRFLFGNQVHENMFWTLAGAVPIWTAYEVVMLWSYANGLLPFVDWETNPVWFVALLLIIPTFQGVHFYLTHRLLHWRPLYEAIHYRHHRNVDVGPWSGLSMHPVEQLIFFSGVLLFLVVASHPIHALFYLQHLALAPAKGHSGFDRVVVKGDKAVRLGNYHHYLHHKYFECNYSGDGMVIFDKVFGTFHDGSDAAHARLKQARLKRARSKMGATEQSVV